ncbi:MAG: pyridoxal 5'-phosphate synthase glutaminase subunit PdxT [Fimbriimonadaceae bacterium]|nr:pyridoxal 5'-phosphate synthase glutaminase subunit PdxT [Chthonomonadaceae bacterium]MCO5296484.1 pyridoxal 5'-phosphate synthase glutaminase subunit PdxT [Fimbriimonadaceae bacterium]
MPRTVGVIAVQGDFEKHAAALSRCDPKLEVVGVRTPEELEGVERVILPGGESTTVGLLMERYGLGAALQAAARGGMPVWGTCMGMILMAHEVVGRDQYTLDLLDISVERNAFGAQVHSFEDLVPIEGLDAPVLGVFIRAPIVTRCGEGVQVLGRYDGKVVAVRQGLRLGTSFHPELTDDIRLHRYFLAMGQDA